jgi:tRNA nucleotidyltransferase (CCA-adding enzyme)
VSGAPATPPAGRRPVLDAARSLRPPAGVLAIARTLQRAGHETWCVGGAVRDALLGIEHLDWDLATAARPEVVRRLFRRTVPVGIQFGTIGVLDADGRMHEVTTFRRDVRTDGRHAEVEFGASLEDDLARRDFTINAIAWDPIAERLADPFDGQVDLARGVVRAVGDPDERFREDRLRALRAIRFAARFGFAIEADTWAAIGRSAPHLGRLSAERVKQELEKTMEQVPRPSAALALWRESGAFGTLIPALADVPDVVLAGVDALPLPGPPTRPLRRTLRLAALFSALDPHEARRVLAALKFSNLDAGTVGTLGALWHELGGPVAAALADAAGAGQSLDDRTVRGWVARIGRLRLAAFARLAAAQWWAWRAVGRPAPTAAAWRALYRRMVRIAFRDPLDVADLAVDGDDLRRAGIPTGPALGRVLQGLVRFVLDDPARNAPELLLREAARLAVEVR